jgi:hypothetical protein
MENCEHENTTDCLIDFTANAHHRDERKYEIYMCTECNRLVNFWNGDVLTGEQVMQLFVDIRLSCLSEIEDIQVCATRISDNLDRILNVMPKK